jgi:hypothetical protein
MFGIRHLAQAGGQRHRRAAILSRPASSAVRTVRRPHLLAATAAFCLVSFLTILLSPQLLFSTPQPSVNPKASEVFVNYIRATDSRNKSELQSGTGLLWIDRLSDAERKRAYAALAQGSIQLKQHTSESSRETECPGCMIHHWEGVVFVPHAQLNDVLGVLEDYNRHSEYYAPDVVRSRIDAHEGDRFRVFLRFRRQKVITVVLNTEHDITYFRDSPSQAHSRSSATHIAEIDNPGKPNEREKSREEDHGFLWGMETWWRMEEKDNGVYVQSEVVSLTRNIPVGLGWMIGPFVTAVPKESLTFTLEATRTAVLAQRHANHSR